MEKAQERCRESGPAILHPLSSFEGTFSGYKEGVKLQGHKAEAALQRQLEGAGTSPSYWWNGGRFGICHLPIGPLLDNMCPIICFLAEGPAGVGGGVPSNTEVTN